MNLKKDYIGFRKKVRRPFPTTSEYSENILFKAFDENSANTFIILSKNYPRFPQKHYNSGKGHRTGELIESNASEIRGNTLICISPQAA